MEINELEAKIKRDRKIDLSRKMTASNILNELARATVKETSLINDEVYREKIQRLQNELAETKEQNSILINEQKQQYESKLGSKNQVIEKMNEEISNLRQRIDNLLEGNVQKHKQGENEHVAQLQEQERLHLQAIAEITAKHSDVIRQIQDRFKGEKEAIVLTCEAKISAFERKNAMKLEKKLKKFEKLLHEAWEVYKEKQLILEGSFVAARKEIELLAAKHRETEKSLREELAIKDARLASYRSKVDNIDGFIREKNNWRTIAADISSLVIHLCAAAEDCSCGPISFTNINSTSAVRVSVSKKKLARILRKSNTIQERMKIESSNSEDDEGVVLR